MIKVYVTYMSSKGTSAQLVEMEKWPSYDDLMRMASEISKEMEVKEVLITNIFKLRNENEEDTNN